MEFCVYWENFGNRIIEKFVNSRIRKFGNSKAESRRSVVRSSNIINLRFILLGVGRRCICIYPLGFYSILSRFWVKFTLFLEFLDGVILVFFLALVGVSLVFEQVSADSTPFATAFASTNSNHSHRGLVFGSFCSSKELSSLFQAFSFEFLFVESLSGFFHLFIDFSVLLLLFFAVDEPA